MLKVNISLIEFASFMYLHYFKQTPVASVGTKELMYSIYSISLACFGAIRKAKYWVYLTCLIPSAFSRGIEDVK